MVDLPRSPACLCDSSSVGARDRCLVGRSFERDRSRLRGSSRLSWSGCLSGLGVIGSTYGPLVPERDLSRLGPGGVGMPGSEY